MSRIRNAFAVGMIAALFNLGVGLVAAQQAQAGHGDLKTVDNPGGGQFVYGSLTGQASQKDALVYMLRLVHKHFGDKPQLGKLMQSRDGSSLAAFFTLQAKTMHQQQLAGLVIISAQSKSDMQAAVLYDESKNFIKTEPSMMKALTSAWKGSLGGGGSNAGQGSSQGANQGNGQGNVQARGSAVPQLTGATGGDRSAVIKMPAGWHLIAVSGGALQAEGDRGEMVMLGVIYQQIINPQNPSAQRLISGGMASRGPKLICPLTPDLFTDYVCAFNQTRRNNGKSLGSFRETSAQPEPGNGPIRPIEARFTVDFNDGMGPRNGSVRIDFLSFSTQGPTWGISASMSNIPEKFGSAIDPTLMAVVKSYSQDAQVIGREGAADLQRIHQQGIANQAQTDAINNRRESSKQSYDSHMQALKANDAYPDPRNGDQHNADIDWQSKINQDYILDRTVIRDGGDNWHATVSNDLADALLKANPTRLEQVPNQQLVQGVDF